MGHPWAWSWKKVKRSTQTKKLEWGARRPKEISDMAIPYYHVDVFTDELFAGNPAGVCVLSVPLANNTMQKIATENRHSESAFVVPRADGDFDLHWFTP